MDRTAKKTRRYRFLAVVLATMPLATSSAAADDPPAPVVTPRVEREASLPAPGVWPSFSGSVGGNHVRNCLTWGDGWEDFVDRKALPAMEAAGRVWVHNPGGMILGEAMEFDQFSRCRQAAALTGNEVLQRVSRWDEFTRHMSRLSERGDLVVYVGTPQVYPPREDETDDEWLARALEEIRPVLDIRPRVAVGLDATYGQPADPDQQKHRVWSRAGGAGGLHARLIDHLIEAGHEVILEPGLLEQADWLAGRVSLISNHGYWQSQMKKVDDNRVRHYLADWGRFTDPATVAARQFRYLQLQKERTPEEESALIDAVLAAGYDCIVPSYKHPAHPFRRTAGED